MHQKGFAPLFIILGVIVILGISGELYYLNTKKIVVPQPQPTKASFTSNQNADSSPSSSPQDSTIKRLDFTKILNERYTVLKIDTYGFSLQHPPEATVYDYTNEEIKEKGSTKFPNGSVVEKAINISLTPIIPKIATEFYEGLAVDIFLLKNTGKRTLAQFVTENTQQKEEIAINGQQAFKVIIKDQMANISRYFLINKSHEYFIVLEVYSIGNDLIQYQKVADKIINSVTLF